MISDTKNFLFIHVPKTGGNSIQKALLPFSDDHIAIVGPHQDGIDRFEIRSHDFDIHKHSSLEDYRRQIDPDRFSRFTKVTCVRNPWDRCISFFFSPHRGSVNWSPDALEDFIRSSVHPHMHYLTLDAQSGDPFDNCDTILRFEHLAEDFAAFCTSLGLGSVPLPRINVSDRGDYRDYYTTRRLVDLVAEKFAPEIERFRYKF